MSNARSRRPASRAADPPASGALGGLLAHRPLDHHGTKTEPPRGYGTFKYGDAMPEPGTQAFADMARYFSLGGSDPQDLYDLGFGLLRNPPSSGAGGQTSINPIKRDSRKES